MNPGKAEVLFPLPLSIFVCLPVMIYRYHQTASLQLLNNICQIYFVEYLSKIRFILPIFFSAIYVVVHFQQIHLSHYDFEDVSNSFYYHYQTGYTNHQPLFGVKSWKNFMHCMPCPIVIVETHFFTNHTFLFTTLYMLIVDQHKTKCRSSPTMDLFYL